MDPLQIIVVIALSLAGLLVLATLAYLLLVRYLFKQFQKGSRELFANDFRSRRF